jgi:disulfide bond formation protein DsbB
MHSAARIDTELIVKALGDRRVFGTVFLILVLIALASNISDLSMRIRLTRRLPLENWFSWWMRSSDDVGRAYQELFPESYLPSAVRYVFWLLLATAAVVLTLVLLRRPN